MHFNLFQPTNFRTYLCIILTLQCIVTSCGHKDRYIVLIDDANGLQKGSEVVFQDKIVGEVSKIKLLENLQIAVTISLDEDFKLPSNSTFLIQAPFIGATKLIVEKSQNVILASKQDTLLGYADTTNTINLLLDSTNKKAAEKIIEGFRELIENTNRDTTKQ